MNAVLPRHTLHTAMLTGCLALSNAYAGDWSLGVGALYEQMPYRDYDAEVYPAPLISYEGERIFLRDSAVAGVYLLKTEKDQLSFNVYYSPMNFRPSRTDDAALTQLDKRYSTAMAGFGYRHDAEWGSLRAEIAADILGKSDGIIVDAMYQYPIQTGNLQVTPGLGVQWRNSNYNDYYFGISGRESLRSGLDAYSPGSGATPYVSLSTSYAINKNWHAFLTGRYTWLDHGAKDSPMTERSGTALIGGGIVYRFE